MGRVRRWLLPVLAAGILAFLFWAVGLSASTIPGSTLLSIDVHSEGAGDYTAPEHRQAPLSPRILVDANQDAQTANPSADEASPSP